MEFGVNVDALLSFISRVPGLTELDLRAELPDRYLDLQNSVLPSSQS